MPALDRTPTRAGFLAFIRDIMGVPTAALADGSIYIDYAFEISLEIVNLGLKCIAPTGYTWAVYNLGGSTLLNIAQDPEGSPVVPGTEPPLKYFAYARKQFNMNGFVSGVIQSASDEGTSESMVVQEAAKNFTLANLQQLKDPYGREYLSIAQSYGDIWGLTT